MSVSFLRRRLSGEVRLDNRNGPSIVFRKKAVENRDTWFKYMAERGLGQKPGYFIDFGVRNCSERKKENPIY